jgi:hypothetical protein
MFFYEQKASPIMTTLFISPKIRRPIKAALAAASEHLAGLLPLHLVYSQAHETAIEVFLVFNYN